MVLEYNPLHCLPSSEELPDSDDTPVDNQLQHLIPGLLEAILALMASSRYLESFAQTYQQRMRKIFSVFLEQLSLINNYL
jgi:hypothetical protein